MNDNPFTIDEVVYFKGGAPGRVVKVRDDGQALVLNIYTGIEVGWFTRENLGQP